MIYIVYGINNPEIESKVRDIKKEFTSDNTDTFDLNTHFLKDILIEADTNSLFSKEKLIIINNSYIFTGKKNDIEHDITKLTSYLENPNPDVTIVFKVNHDKLDSRKKITKLVSNKYKLIDCNKVTDTNSYIKSLLTGIDISEQDINYLIERVGDNKFNLENEVIKLKNYISDNKITKEDIDEVTILKKELDFFTFIDYIVNINKEKSLISYQTYLENGEEPIKLIVTLANQFRLILQSKILLESGFDQTKIASDLQVHPYRVKLAIQKGMKYNKRVLTKILGDLADLDHGIKSGKLEKDLAFELFILNLAN